MTSAKDFDMEEIMEIEHAMGRNTKRPVDENHPKRAMSAYFLWANKTRPSVVKANPDATLGEVGKRLGVMWRSVSTSDRAPFQAKADKDWSAYEKKKEKYMKTASYKKHQKMVHAWKIHETKKPYPRDPNSPKRGMSAYMLYAESVRGKIVKENPDMSSTEIMREQSVWWKALSEKDRVPFVEKAASEKAKFDKRLERYMTTSDYQRWQEGKTEYKLAMKEKRNKLMGIKKKRARSVNKSKGQKSPSKKKQKKRRSKSRSVSKKRRARRSKTPKSSKSRSRSSKRKARTPKKPKKSKRRSSSKSTSRSRSASTSRSASRSRSKKSKSPKRRPGRRKESKKKSKKRSTGRRAMKAKKRTKKNKKVAEDSDVAE